MAILPKKLLRSGTGEYNDRYSATKDPNDHLWSNENLYAKRGYNCIRGCKDLSTNCSIMCVTNEGRGQRCIRYTLWATETLRMITILSIYALLNIAIIVWFFIIRPKQIDKEYEEKLGKIYSNESN